MKIQWKSRGFAVYEKDQDDLRGEALLELARRQAQGFDDEEVAELGALFDQWRPGAAYTAGQCLCDEAGNLYRVLQDHTAQADWGMERTPALFRRLGVTDADPDAIPDWVQPTGGHDCYHKGDRVRYGGKVYESTMDGNVWEPGVVGWTPVS